MRDLNTVLVELKESQEQLLEVEKITTSKDEYSKLRLKVLKEHVDNLIEEVKYIKIYTPLFNFIDNNTLCIDEKGYKYIFVREDVLEEFVDNIINIKEAANDSRGD